jgi:Uma2 family endonuclease
MNLHSSAPTDPDAFLRWNEGREGRRELVNGRVVEMMIHVTRGHARLVARLSGVLSELLDRRRFEVFTSDLGIKTPEGVRYPDVVIDVAGGRSEDLAVTAPVLVCEVLSPSSLVIDLVEKQREYTGIPSVMAYLVLSQDEPRAWLWLRESEGWSGPATIEGPGAEIAVPALSLAIPLRLVYPDAPAA